MDELDTDRSYFALKWQFQMSLTSKISSKKLHKHPHLLVYYSFQVDNTWTRQLSIIGMQASTFGGLQRWLSPPLNDREVYFSLSNRLRDLVKVTIDRETQKYLLRK